MGRASGDAADGEHRREARPLAPAGAYRAAAATAGRLALISAAVAQRAAVARCSERADAAARRRPGDRRRGWPERRRGGQLPIDLRRRHGVRVRLLRHHRMPRLALAGREARCEEGRQHAAGARRCGWDRAGRRRAGGRRAHDLAGPRGSFFGDLLWRGWRRRDRERGPRRRLRAAATAAHDDRHVGRVRLLRADEGEQVSRPCLRLCTCTCTYTCTCTCTCAWNMHA